jgi:ribosome recycling factor
MIGSIAHLEKKEPRAGKASPAMLGSFVDYYGSATPLSQVAN